MARSIDKMAKQLGVEASAVSSFKNLCVTQNSNQFATLEKSLSKYNANAQLTNPQFAKVLKQIGMGASAKVTKFELAQGATNFLSSIGQATGNRGVMRMASIAGGACKIYSSYATLSTALAAGGGTVSGAIASGGIGSVAVPVVGIALAAFSIFGGLFGDDDDDGMAEFLNAIMEQLSHISEQVKELHEDMIREFKDVHKHLGVIHQNMLLGFHTLEKVLTQEIQQARLVSVSHLQDICANQRRNLNLLSSGQRDISQLSLRKDLTLAAKSLVGEKQEYEKFEIRRISSSLLNWALQEARQGMFTGAKLFTQGYDRSKFANQNQWINHVLYDHQLPNLLGFLQSHAVSALGAKFTHGVAYNPAIWLQGANSHLGLVDRFLESNYFDKSGDVKEIQDVVSSGKQQLQFFKELRGNSKLIFGKLLQQYETCVANINKVVASRLKTKTNQVNRELKETGEQIDLSWNEDDLSKKLMEYKGVVGKNITVKAKLHRINKDHTVSYYMANANISILYKELQVAKMEPLEGLFAEKLGLATLKFNGVMDIEKHIRMYGSAQEYRELRNSAFKKMDKKNRGYHRFLWGVRNGLHADIKLCIGNSTIISFVCMLASGPLCIRKLLTTKKLNVSPISEIARLVHVQNMATNTYKRFLVKDIIKNPKPALDLIHGFLVKHKVLVAKSLLADLPENVLGLSPHLTKLDSIVNLIKAYALAAGLNPKEYGKLNKLWHSNQIIADLKSYLTNKLDINKPFITPVNPQTYSNIKTMLMGLANNTNISSLMESRVMLTTSYAAMLKEALVKHQECSELKKLTIVQSGNHAKRRAVGKGYRDKATTLATEIKYLSDKIAAKEQQITGWRILANIDGPKKAEAGAYVMIIGGEINVIKLDLNKKQKELDTSKQQQLIHQKAHFGFIYQERLSNRNQNNVNTGCRLTLLSASEIKGNIEALSKAQQDRIKTRKNIMLVKTVNKGNILFYSDKTGNIKCLSGNKLAMLNQFAANAAFPGVNATATPVTNQEFYKAAAGIIIPELKWGMPNA